MAHIELLRASPMPEIPELALGSDEAGGPPSLPSQVKVQVTMEADTEPLKASPMPQYLSQLQILMRQVIPPSSPPQVEVQASMGTHIEPPRASPMIEMPEPTNASITIVEHKQSSALAHEVAD